MTRRGAPLFAVMSVVWGIPYLLIKVAVRHLNPAVIVEARTLIGAAVLLPLALKEGRVAPLLARWRPLAVYCIAELAVPWFLLTSAETRLPSSLAGLLVATVPLVSLALAVVAARVDQHRLGRVVAGKGAVAVAESGAASASPVVGRRAVSGLLVGLAGVGVVLGVGAHGVAAGPVVEVLVVAVGYAVGPFVATRWLSDQSSLALAAISLAAVAVIYMPVAAVQAPRHVPGAEVLASVATLGLVCTAVAFVAFFELLREMPPTQATVFTYFNPVVAVVLGVAVLGEAFHLSTAAGFLLILAGSWMSTRK